MKVPYLDLKSHHAPLRDEFERAIRDVIDSGIFASGPAVTRFEEAFARFCECDHAVGLGSGTEAVWLALHLHFGVVVLDPSVRLASFPGEVLVTPEWDATVRVVVEQ